MADMAGYTMPYGHNVWTLTLTSDGEVSVRVFATEQARDAALVRESLDRYSAAKEAGEQEDWTEVQVEAKPAEFISDSTYGSVEVYTDTVTVEGGAVSESEILAQAEALANLRHDNPTEAEFASAEREIRQYGWPTTSGEG